uniref:Uncharacterized protein n=2 Tax=Aegilops tauschii subsp. strangulata TaxID=200361 RepID=A0A453DGW6_AEGTS
PAPRRPCPTSQRLTAGNTDDPPARGAPPVTWTPRSGGSGRVAAAAGLPPPTQPAYSNRTGGRCGVAGRKGDDHQLEQGVEACLLSVGSGAERGAGEQPSTFGAAVAVAVEGSRARAAGVLPNSALFCSALVAEQKGEWGDGGGGAVRRAEVLQGLAQGAGGGHPARQQPGVRVLEGLRRGVPADAHVLQPRRAPLPLPPAVDRLQPRRRPRPPQDPHLQGLCGRHNHHVHPRKEGQHQGVLRGDIPLPHAAGARDQRLRRPEAEGGVLRGVQAERRAGGQQEAGLRDRRRDRRGVRDLHGAQQQGRAAQLQPRHVHQLLPSMVSENEHRILPSRYHLFFSFSAMFSSLHFNQSKHVWWSLV